MKRMITIFVIMFLATGQIAAQDKEKEEFIINHTVELGETVLMICKKYVVLPSDFYKYNKETIHGIKQGEVLRIPLHMSKKKNAIEMYQKSINSSYVNAPDKKSYVKMVKSD